MNRILLGISLLLYSLLGIAAIDTYEFKDEAARERFKQLSAELRCPKCQNQNLADSDSGIAADLRREIFRMLDEGESDEQIIDFMVVRYGEFVLYRPQVNERTWLLWYGPLVLLAIGAGVIIILAIKRSKPKTDSLSTEEQARLDNLLSEDTDK